MGNSGQGRPETAERLVAAAVACFSRKWYGTVSVAEICREAGLSNGVYYRYFPDKESLIKVILGRVLAQIRTLVEDVDGPTPEVRLQRLAEAMFRFSREHADLVAVFREGQYRYFEFEQRLMAIYQRGLGRLLGREANLAEYLFAFGGLRFCAIRWASGAAPIAREAVCEIAARGLYRGLGFDPARVFGGAAKPLPVPLEEGVRERLLRAGRRLFGEKGYFETNIHEITGQAHLSVGAFYTHFDSKEAFFAELIDRVGLDVRTFIVQNLPPGAEGLNALELELRSLWLWIVHLSLDRHCYNLVREAEFVLPAVVRDYYAGFAEGYRRRPPGLGVAQRAPAIDETTAIEYLMGVAHYFGLEAAFETSPLNARGLVESLGHLLAQGLLPTEDARR